MTYSGPSSNILRRSPLPPGLRFVILKRDNYRCQICGHTALSDPDIILEVDHKIPVAEGGTNAHDNLWTLCFECNRGKSDDFLTEADEAQSVAAQRRKARAAAQAKKIAEGREPHPNPFRRMREAAGISRAVFAKKAGLTLASVIRLETDKPVKQKMFWPKMYAAYGNPGEAFPEAMNRYSQEIIRPLLVARQAEKKAKAGRRHLQSIARRRIRARKRKR